MGLSVGLALLTAVVVVVFLFLLTKLVRFVRAPDEPKWDPSRSSPLRRSDLPPPMAPVAQMPGSDEPEGTSISVMRSPEPKVEKDEGTAEDRSVAAVSGSPVEQGAANPNYGGLGEQVTAVLASAEQAAAEIRQSALLAADQIRAEADAYAQQTRAAADELATKERAALEEEVQALRAEAQRKANEIEADALRRRELLEDSAAHLDERIARLLSAFRGMTAELEDLVPLERRTLDGEPSPAADEDVLDDVFEDALKPERASSR